MSRHGEPQIIQGHCETSWLKTDWTRIQLPPELHHRSLELMQEFTMVAELKQVIGLRRANVMVIRRRSFLITSAKS